MKLTFSSFHLEIAFISMITWPGVHIVVTWVLLCRHLIKTSPYPDNILQSLSGTFSSVDSKLHKLTFFLRWIGKNEDIYFSVTLDICIPSSCIRRCRNGICMTWILIVWNLLRLRKPGISQSISSNANATRMRRLWRSCNKLFFQRYIHVLHLRISFDQ